MMAVVHYLFISILCYLSFIYVDNDEAFLSVFDFLLFFFLKQWAGSCASLPGVQFFILIYFHRFYILYLAALKLAAWFSYSDEGLADTKSVGNENF